MKRAFIIIGPGNSGQRFLTRLFLENGCWGDEVGASDNWTQRLEDGTFPKNDSNIAWRTHCPILEDGPRHHPPGTPSQASGNMEIEAYNI